MTAPRFSYPDSSSVRRLEGTVAELERKVRALQSDAHELQEAIWQQRSNLALFAFVIVQVAFLGVLYLSRR